MALELQRGLKPYWYARLLIDGVRVCHTLKTKVEGIVPKPLSAQSDVAFEVCRALAQAEHDELAAMAREKRRDEKWLEKIYEAKTGKPAPSIALSEMSTRWKELGVRSEDYTSQVEEMHIQFLAFLAKPYPRVKAMADVRENMAKEFMAQIEAVGYAPGTYNNKLDALRSTFNALAAKAGVSTNPFAGIEEQEDDIVSRIPFTEQELESILAVAERPEHALINPVLVTGSMTAMRRADCCLLEKSAINRAENKISVRAAKTKKKVVIPIAPRLAALLDRLPPSDSKYVFPECAREFMLHPDYITYRTRAVFKDAGFFNQEPGGPTPIGSVQVKREKGKGVRAASTRDFHSLRATWVTIAIMSNVPIESVCLITGHSSPETLRRHYFMPGFEAFRRVLSDNLPPVLGGTRRRLSVSSDTLAQIVAKLAGMSSENWAHTRDEIVAMIAPVQPVSSPPA